MTSKRTTRTFKIGGSQAIVLPCDWLRGNDIRPGDEVELLYNGIVRIRPLRREMSEGDGNELPTE